MKKKFTTDVPTMGVAVDMQGVHLFINPYFLKDMTVPAQAEVLKHECEHPLRGHFEREKTLAPDLHKKEQTLIERYKNMSTAYLLNIAEDYAINETLPNLPKTFRVFNPDGTPQKNPETDLDIQATPALVTDLIAQFPDEKIERNQAMEYYYSFIKEKADKGEFNGQAPSGIQIMPLDEHDILNESAKEIDPEFAKAIINKLAQDAKDSTPGKIPGHIELAINELNKKTKDWRQDVQIFGAMCQNSELEPTNKRRNRRYGLLYPGNRVKVKSHLVVVIDSSASVNDKQLTQLVSELTAIHATGVDITVIECDTQVNQVYRFDPTYKFKVVGRGGTYFWPAFDKVIDPEFVREYGEIDGLIYLTDGGDYGQEAQEPNFPVLWALLPQCDVRYNWGHKTFIEVS